MKFSSYYLRQRAQLAGDQVEGVECIEQLTRVIALPPRIIATGEATEAGYLYPKVRPTAARPPRGPSGHRTVARRVLVLGDQRDVVENWAWVLGRAGHRVRGTWTEPGTLALAEAFQPDAAVLDLSWSSDALGWQLRRVPGLDGTLLIALAEHGTNQDRRRCRAAGCDYHLTRPVDAAVLLQLLAIPVEPP